MPEVDGKLSPSDKPYDYIGSTSSDISETERMIEAGRQRATEFRRLVDRLNNTSSRETEITPNPSQIESYNDLPYERMDV